MNNSSTFVAAMQCAACGRIRRVSGEHLGRKLRCQCGNIAVATEQSLISLTAATSTAAEQKSNAPLCDPNRIVRSIHPQILPVMIWLSCSPFVMRVDR